MKSSATVHQVNGHRFTVWGDYMARATFAEDEAGTVKRIYGGGYLSNELTIRKAIATAFQLPTFRK